MHKPNLGAFGIRALQDITCNIYLMKIPYQPSFSIPGTTCSPADCPVGARLTAYEIVQDNLPGTLIADSAAASLMAAGRVDAIVVGADRVAANGDTANKIGTYSLAVNAKRHK